MPKLTQPDRFNNIYIYIEMVVEVNNFALKRIRLLLDRSGQGVPFDHFLLIIQF